MQLDSHLRALPDLGHIPSALNAFWHHPHVQDIKRHPVVQHMMANPDARLHLGLLANHVHSMLTASHSSDIDHHAAQIVHLAGQLTGGRT